jgi:hypothetical protein
MTAPTVPAGYVQDNAASVRGLVMRVTRLGSDGAPTVGSPCDVYLTSGFINFTFTPEYTTGEEISITNASGAVCVYYKSPDTLQSVTVGLELCDPDPVLTQMLAGGEVLTAAGNSDCAPVGTDVTDTVAIGYAADALGSEGSGYGVSIEVWAQAVVGGKAANNCPYWRYLIPYAKFRLDGDRVVENGNLATVFSGTGGGNAAFGPGPNMDLTGVSPTPVEGIFDWDFPTYTDRPFLYARDMNAPLGLQGCYRNLGIPIVAIVPGAPAQLVPVNATRPANLEDLQAMGAMGQTTAWPPGYYLRLGDGTDAYWDGSQWVEGRSPQPVIPATTAYAGSPGYFGPPGATIPQNLAALDEITASPTTAWLQGQYVHLADNTQAYWDGSMWKLGLAPVPPVPTISSVTPIQGSQWGGTLLSILGSNFTNATGVNFGANPGTDFTVVSATEISVRPPAGAIGQVNVVVVSPVGNGTLANGYRYVSTGAPTVTSVAPATGPAAGGTVVTLTGTNLEGTTEVAFAESSGTNLTVDSPTQLHVTTPAMEAGTYDVALLHPGGNVTKTGGYTFT